MQYDRYTVESRPAPWDEVADLFVECFSGDPYFEDADELRTISEWGSAQIADGTGVLVTARREGRIDGLALAHGLSEDRPWQTILTQLEHVEGPAAEALLEPTNALVLYELAVRPAARGHGIAAGCVAMLLQERSEAQTFIGVYDRAADAAAMYDSWQVEDIGRVPMSGDAVSLHVRTAPTAQLLRRVGKD